MKIEQKTRNALRPRQRAVFPCVVFSVALAWLALLAGGCARYQVGGPYRPDISTVHVPVFESTSYRRGLGERLTEAVIKEIENRTPYKVVASPNADSILTGTILLEEKRPRFQNPFSEPRELEVAMTVEVRWIDRTGALLSQQQAVSVPSELVEIEQSVQLVPEFGQSIATSQQQVIERTARQIVNLMEVSWLETSGQPEYIIRPY
ncbi:MAG: LPS assembly lipoprotein LptE [Pirellulales bacterium]|nr:LPS assembly lipoprotein LptE [Pirellulales bacterium]